MIPLPLRTTLPLVGIAALLLGVVLHFTNGIVVAEDDAMGAAIAFHVNIFIAVYFALVGVAFLGALLSNSVKMLNHKVFIASLVPLSLIWMLAYHIVFEKMWPASGAQQFAMLMLGYVVPTAYLAWWLALARHGQLKSRDTLVVMVPGVVMIAFVFVSILGNIPTDILELSGWTFNTLVNNTISAIIAVVGLSIATVAYDSLVGGASTKHEKDTHAHA